MEKGQRFGKVMLYIVGGIIVLLALVHLVVTAVYCRFFMGAKSKFLLPGMDSPFVQQGLDYVQEQEIYLFSGYMNDGSASRIYIREDGGEVRFVELKNANGTDYTRHCGGICHNGRYVYVAGKNGLTVFTLDDILDGGNATVLGQIETGFDVDYCAFQEGYLLAGMQDSALLAVYRGGEGGVFGVVPNPVAAISVPENIRGVCITGENELALSTSDGIKTSRLSYYHVNVESRENTAVSNVEVPLYCLNAVEDVAMPPMAQGILYQDGKVHVMFQSASNKYVFGKFIRGYQVFAYEKEGEN